MAGSSDLDEARTAEDKDEGQGEVNENIVREEGDGDDQWEADAAFAVDCGQ